jgi:hypothetical protein
MKKIKAVFDLSLGFLVFNFSKFVFKKIVIDQISVNQRNQTEPILSAFVDI